MPSSWQDWKQEASLLGNQWRCYHTTCSLSNMASRAPASSSKPSLTTSYAPFPHSTHSAVINTSGTKPCLPSPELNCNAAPRKDPKHGLCFKCDKPSHIAHDCHSGQMQKIRLVEPEQSSSISLSPSELQLMITEAMHAAMTSPLPPNPPSDKDESNTSNEDF